MHYFDRNKNCGRQIPICITFANNILSQSVHPFLQKASRITAVVTLKKKKFKCKSRLQKTLNFENKLLIGPIHKL